MAVCCSGFHAIIGRLGSWANDVSNGNNHSTNQWFDWLNEEKYLCCMCGRLFGAIFLSSLPNDNVKFSFSRFWEQCKLSAVTLSLPLNENHSCQASKSALHLFCTTRPTNLMQSSISMIHFGCSSCHSFFNSPIMYQAYWKLAQVSSPNTWSIKFYITYIDTSIICGLIINPHTVTTSPQLAWYLNWWSTVQGLNPILNFSVISLATTGTWVVHNCKDHTLKIHMIIMTWWLGQFIIVITWIEQFYNPTSYS